MNNLTGEKDKNVSFATFMERTFRENSSLSYDNSFLKLDEKRELNTIEYKERMKKTRLKVKIRDN